MDVFGNLHTRIGTAPIMWSCHTDTVHRTEGFQRIMVGDDGLIKLRPNRKGQFKSNCLGADDGSGIWLLLEMIEAKVEGLYIFHRDEETGGKGSAYIVEQTPELVKDILYAVAFDRRGTESVITKQRGRRCSDNFGEGLAKALKMEHKIDDTGSFTDTANYYELIPECTNISSGYACEHGVSETLDLRYLYKLRIAILGLDISTLSVTRKITDDLYDFPSYGAYGNQGNLNTWGGHTYWNGYKTRELLPIEKVDQLIRLNARYVARMFIDLGFSYDELRKELAIVDLSRTNVWTGKIGNTFRDIYKSKEAIVQID